MRFLFKIILFGFAVLTVGAAYAQQVVHGYIMTPDEIAVANVKVEEVGTKNFCMSRADGSFSLFYYSNTSNLLFSHTDYDSLIRPIDSLDMKVFLNLKGNGYNLAYLPGYTDFTNKIANKRLDLMPFFLGEADVNRSLQMLPGVEHGNEGFSNLLVRGGNFDENLMLYNGTPVYNYNHLFGVSSLFNMNGVEDVRLSKGISSSRYGGRLSSVIQVESVKNSEYSGVSGDIEISLLAAGINIKSIVKDTSYLTFSARRSYIDQMLTQESRDNSLNAYLYDIQLNYGRYLENGDQVHFSLMHSKDKYFQSQEYPDSGITEIVQKLNLSWGNFLASVKYDQTVSEQMTAEHSVHFSNFGSTLAFQWLLIAQQNSKGFPTVDESQKRGIREYIAQSNWSYTMENSTDLYFGAQANVKTFRPNYTSITSINYADEADSEETYGDKGFSPSFELAVYGEYDRSFDKLQFTAGLRASLYNYKALTSLYPEPRLSMRYALDSRSALKLGYNRHHQFARLINSGGTEGIQNFWVPATELIRPQRADILALDYERKLGNSLAFTASSYYKFMSNIHVVTNFSDAAEAGGDWEEQVVLGEGRAYGVELMMQFNKNPVSGWLAYHYGKADRLYPDLSVDVFPFQFDRRHMLKVYGNFIYNQHWSFGVNYLYGSGQLFSIPDGKFKDLDGNIQLEYSSLNNYRSQNYQRLDLSVVKVRERTSMNQKWKFYLYNMIGTKNALSLSPEFTNGFTTFTVDRMYIGVLPGVSYTLSF